jgi:hypothetical protein
VSSAQAWELNEFNRVAGVPYLFGHTQKEPIFAQFALVLFAFGACLVPNEINKFLK